MRHFHFTTARWNTPEKIEYRQKCIIEPFYLKYGTKSLDKSLFYWSICGSNSFDGTEVKGSEIDHMVSSGLISPEQFVGVDRDDSIIKRNTSAYPLATWICDDFETAIHTKTHLRPGIIHADTTQMSRSIQDIVQDLMTLAEYQLHPVMLIVNTIVRRWVDRKEESISQAINRIALNTVEDGWEISKLVYGSKGGVRGGKAEMAALVMFFGGKGLSYDK
jgi:hypothetical protein